YAVTAWDNGSCVRGQRLFIRPIEATDAAVVNDFLRANESVAGAPAFGLIGKLVGDLVAVLAMEITTDAVRIDSLIVARELRRKRIGRFMVEELARLARKIDRDRIVVDEPDGARGFFRKLGFVDCASRMELKIEN